MNNECLNLQLHSAQTNRRNQFGKNCEMTLTIVLRNSAAKVQRLNYFITIVETSMKLY